MKENDLTVTIPITLYDNFLRESHALAILLQHIENNNKEIKQPYDQIIGTVDLRFVKAITEATYY